MLEIELLAAGMLQRVDSAAGHETLRVTDAGHIAAPEQERFGADILFRTPRAASLDGNTVDSEYEKSEFLRNAVEYQASLKFLDGKIRSLMTAIKGE